MRDKEFVFQKTTTKKFTGISIDLTVKEAWDILDMIRETCDVLYDEEAESGSPWGETTAELYERLRAFVEKHGHRPSPSNG